MKLDKIQASYVVSGDERRQQQEQKNKQKKDDVKTEKSGLASALNKLLVAKDMPYRILESNGEYFYTSVQGEVLGSVQESQLMELLENVKLGNSEVERKLTYDGQAPSGNFLDLDI